MAPLLCISDQSYLRKDILMFGHHGSLKQRHNHTEVQNLVSNGNTNATFGLGKEITLT